MGVRTLDLPDEKAAWITRALERDEEVVWSGEPTPRLFTRENTREALLGVASVLASTYWVWRVVDGLSRAGYFEPYWLIGVAWLFAGSAMIVAPVRFRSQLARTAYAVTDRRLLIVTRGRFGRHVLRVFEPTDLGDPYSEARAGDTADVYFARTFERYRGRTRLKRNALYGVRRARAAEDALRALRAAEDASLAHA